MEKDLVRYSEAFKLHIVKELESGRIRRKGETQTKYGISGSNTVGKWVAKYGRERPQHKVVRVETRGERDQLKALQVRIKEPERAVVDS